MFQKWGFWSLLPKVFLWVTLDAKSTLFTHLLTSEDTFCMVLLLSCWFCSFRHINLIPMSKIFHLRTNFVHSPCDGLVHVWNFFYHPQQHASWIEFPAIAKYIHYIYIHIPRHQEITTFKMEDDCNLSVYWKMCTLCHQAPYFIYSTTSFWVLQCTVDPFGSSISSVYLERWN